MLAIDDAHLLDDASLACLIELAHHSDVRVVATARSTEPMPAELTALWAGEAVARLDVEPLPHSDTTELARRLLGGQVGVALAEQLWERTHGVPLFVRELVLDAVAQRLVTRVDDTWELEGGALRAGVRVQELITARTADLDPPSLALIELLAVAAPLSVELLAEHELHVLDTLEQQRLARVELIAGRWMVRADHPLIREALAATLSTRRRLELLRDAAGRLVTAGSRAAGDALRAAEWLAESHQPIPAPVALAAGREALVALALDRACELARAVLDEAPREGHLLLGEALRLQGAADEAEAALGVASELAEDDDTIVQVAMWRSTLRAHHAGDPEGALALLDAAADRVGAPERELELRSEAAFLAGILGRLDVAVDANRRILASDGLDAPARWTAMMNQLFGQVMLADLTGIDELTSGMATMFEDIAPMRPEGIDLYWALTAAVHALRGDLARCEAEFVPHVQRCIADEALHGVTAAILVHPLLYRGSPNSMAIADAACAATDRSDPFLVAPIARSARAFTLAQADDLDGARAALAELGVERTGDPRLDGFIGRARAAVLALEGQLDDAAEVTAAMGRECIDGSYVQLGIFSLYDAVRYGRADLVTEDLRRHGASTAAPLIDSMVAHAVGSADRDVESLAKCAATLAEAGARTLVAEVQDEAARVAEDAASAARAATSAALWRRVTPAPNALARSVASPLTDRELDVVQRVVQGQATKAIAEQMFLASRTVEDHLAEACQKLGVSNRSDLVTALAPVPPAN